MKVLSVFLKNNYYRKFFRKFWASISMRTQRILKNIWKDFKNSVFKLFNLRNAIEIQKKFDELWKDLKKHYAEKFRKFGLCKLYF